MSKKNGKKIALVTGAHGFLGSHVVNRLLEEGYNVHGLQHEQLRSPFEIQIKPDVVIHLSAYGNHSDQNDDSLMLVDNILATFNLLTACKDAGANRFLFISSSSVYGTKKAPMVENMTLDTRTMYGAVKVASESLTRAFAHKYNLPSVILRPFSVYGPGEADWRFIPTAIRSMVTKERIQVINEPTHDWLYIDDFVDAVMAVITSGQSWKAGVFNVGTGIATSNEDVLKALSYITERSVYADPKPYQDRPDHSPLWVADTRQMTQFMQWTAKTDLSTGLRKTYDFYKDKYQKQGTQEKNH